MPDVRHYVALDGTEPFGKWFDATESNAALKVNKTLDKLRRGLRPGVKSVGGGVLEARIDYGPGYRVYFGLDGDELIILVGGGTKTTQSEDIQEATENWRAYKAEKKRGTGRHQWHRLPKASAKRS